MLAPVRTNAFNRALAGPHHKGAIGEEAREVSPGPMVTVRACALRMPPLYGPDSHQDIRGFGEGGVAGCWPVVN